MYLRLNQSSATTITEFENNAFLEETGEESCLQVKVFSWTWECPLSSQETLDDLKALGIIE